MVVFNGVQQPSMTKRNSIFILPVCLFVKSIPLPARIRAHRNRLAINTNVVVGFTAHPFSTFVPCYLHIMLQKWKHVGRGCKQLACMRCHFWTRHSVALTFAIALFSRHACVLRCSKYEGWLCAVGAGWGSNRIQISVAAVLARPISLQLPWMLWNREPTLLPSPFSHFIVELDLYFRVLYAQLFAKLRVDSSTMKIQVPPTMIV